MQVDAQRFLELTEKAGTVVFLDIEATGLRGDYNSVLCVSLKPFGKEAYTYAVEKPGNDKRVVKEVKQELLKYDVVVTYYGKGFDWKMINTRLLRWQSEPLKKMLHIDMFFTLGHHLLTARRSQAHLLDWLQIDSTADEKPIMGDVAKKMSVSAEEWNRVLSNPEKSMKTMVKRCESDVAGLEALYRRTRHMIKDVKA